MKLLGDISFGFFVAFALAPIAELSPTDSANQQHLLGDNTLEAERQEGVDTIVDDFVVRRSALES